MGARPKVFINGISGLLGFHLAWQLRHKYLVSGTCYRNQVVIPGVQAFPLTLKNMSVLEAIVRAQSPDFIIGAAGMNDRKEVEQQPKLSDMVNIVMPVSLAVLAGRMKSRFIMLSCAEVFDGDKGMYAEDSTDFTLADSVGKQKSGAHSYIRAQTLESTTLRVGRVLGIGLPYRHSFFDRIRATAAAKKSYEASKKKTRSYISTVSLVRAVEAILESEFPVKHRTFHVGGANMTEFDFVSAWYKLMGADPKLVGEFPGEENNLSLDCKLMELQFSRWKAEKKQDLLLNLLGDLMPVTGTKKWQQAVQSL